MLKLQAEKISFKYEDAALNILEDISFSVYDDQKIGLIGKNGCGKSTLLKLLKGELSVRKGSLKMPPGVKISYLAQDQNQEVDENESVLEFLLFANQDVLEVKKSLDNQEISEEDMGALVGRYVELGGYTLEVEIKNLLEKYGYPCEILKERLRQFSGGEKTKLALLRILLEKPDFLILDEPTNHLDKEQLLWLEKYLHTFKGSYLVVSHDRWFLDQCVNCIWEIENLSLNIFSGNYSFYRDFKEKKEAEQLAKYQSITKKIKQLKGVKHNMKNWAGSFQAQTGANGAAYAFESVVNKVAKAYKRYKVMERKVDKLTDEANDEKPFIEKKRKLKLNTQISGKNKVLQLIDLQINYQTKQVPIKPFNLYLERGERICLEGENGSGKTSLFKAIMHKLPEKIITGKIYLSSSIRTAYYAQELETLNEDFTIMEELKRRVEVNGTEFDQTIARNCLGCFNIRKDEVLRKIEKLSPGEKSKVLLTSILLQDADLLILDEPTNHLEIAAREALEDALINYEGSIIFVSHDRYFKEKIADKFLTI